MANEKKFRELASRYVTLQRASDKPSFEKDDLAIAIEKLFKPFGRKVFKTEWEKRGSPEWVLSQMGDRGDFIVSKAVWSTIKRAVEGKIDICADGAAGRICKQISKKIPEAIGNCYDKTERRDNVAALKERDAEWREKYGKDDKPPKFLMQPGKKFDAGYEEEFYSSVFEEFLGKYDAVTPLERKARIILAEHFKQCEADPSVQDPEKILRATEKATGFKAEEIRSTLWAVFKNPQTVLAILSRPKRSWNSKRDAGHVLAV